ncbi:MAG: DUF262 domain-containing HNH endonuclease family protein [Anaerolineales bacterium]|jgi:hypothetical protein
MEQAFKFDANDLPLSSVFFGADRKYSVPRFQRPYAWGIEQVTEFWDDIISNDEPYFLGSFIFNLEHEKKDGCVDIIDGQQRLLTITLLMAVIRDLAQVVDRKEAELFQRQDIAIEDWEGKSSFRIKPAETLEAFFAKYIQSNSNDIFQSKPASTEEKHVLANYEYLKEKVQGEIDRFQNKDEKIKTLKQLRKKLRDLMVINIEISREEDAYDIFETTNARGMELSVGDLLKNLIFKNIKPGGDRDVAKDVWKDIVKNIEETNTELKRFIRYFWNSKYGFVQEKKLYKEIKKNISPSDWEPLLQDLWDDSVIYNTMLEGTEADFQDYGKHYQEIFESIFAIRLMGVSQCYVLLLSILRNFKKLGFDPYRIFQLIEKFTFQYSVMCKLPGNRLEKLYSKYALEIDKGAMGGPNERTKRRLNSIFSRLENDIKNEAPSKTLFMEYFPYLIYKNSEESRMLIKYFLGKVNTLYEGTDEHLINFNAVNIEHILPQNPDKKWNLTKNQIKDYVNKIGNLTLLSEVLNSKAQNDVISVKLLELEKSKLGVTQKLVKLIKDSSYSWGEEQINIRQAELAELAYEIIWKIQ